MRGISLAFLFGTPHKIDNLCPTVRYGTQGSNFLNTYKQSQYIICRAKRSEINERFSRSPKVPAPAIPHTPMLPESRNFSLANTSAGRFCANILVWLLCSVWQSLSLKKPAFGWLFCTLTAPWHSHVMLSGCICLLNYKTSINHYIFVSFI